jgi:hypothetical protein
MAKDSHSPTSQAIAAAKAILTNLGDSPNLAITTDPTGSMLGDRDSILSLATNLQNMLGDAMHMDTIMFPLKTGTPCKRQTLPHHLWPQAVLHDVHTVRNRDKAFRRLAVPAAATPLLTLETISDT